jgi:hypothetical protein
MAPGICGTHPRDHRTASDDFDRVAFCGALNFCPNLLYFISRDHRLGHMEKEKTDKKFWPVSELRPFALTSQTRRVGRLGPFRKSGVRQVTPRD